jgi:hypothetical protein
MRSVARMFVVLGLVVGLAIALSGCASKNAGGAKSADELYADAMNDLTEELSDVDMETPPWEWDADMDEPLDKFDEALEVNPNHCGALLGSAFTRLLTVLMDPEIGEIMGELFPPEPGRDGGPLLWCTRRPDVERLIRRLERDRQDFDFSRLQEFVEDTVLPALDVADQRLTRFEDLSCEVVLTIDVPDKAGRGRTTMEIEIDASDAYFMHTALDAVQAAGHAIAAYNIDVQEGQSWYDLIEDDANFLNLRAGGHMPAAYDELGQIADHLVDACNSLEGETDDQTTDLIGIDEGYLPLEYIVGPGAVDQIRGAGLALADALENGLTVNPSDFDGSAPDVDISIDFTALFLSPIADLRDYFPEHTWSDPDTMEVPHPIVFPDPTFDGITPGMTNAAWELIRLWLED